MTELRDAAPITFDFDAAAQVARQFTETASFLRSQVPHRNALASRARVQWRGTFEVQFGERMNTCGVDAHRLADAMDLAASQVEELARLAREEQERRTAAREWKEAHDAWEREQANDNVFENLGDVAFGSGEPAPPNLEPTPPPTIPIEAPRPTGPR